MPFNPLDVLPPGWMGWLSAESFLRLQCVSHGYQLPSEQLEAVWSGLCASKLGLRNTATPFVLRPQAAAAQKSGPARFSLQHQWLKAFMDLETCTMENQLRNQPQHFASLPEAEEDEGPPSDVEFSQDENGQYTRCRFTGRLGGDRCVLALEPLPEPNVDATALPEVAASGWQWRLAHRAVSYYEVSMGDMPEHSTAPSRRQCISVGLATGELSASCLRRQQAGWNRESWALHGDDGQIYHGSGWGAQFVPRPLCGGQSNRCRTRRPLFGAGDTVGCGLLALAPPPQSVDEPLTPCSSFGIFFTLNGSFLGVAFIFRADADVAVWPCVGIDAHWPLDFNFGRKPFVLNLEELEVQFLEELRTSPGSEMLGLESPNDSRSASVGSSISSASSESGSSI